MPSLAEIEDRLEQLLPADRAFFEPLTVPPWRRRQRRLAARDEAVRAAVRQFFPGRLTCAAARLARALGAYANAGWRWEQYIAVLPDEIGGRHRATHEILIANNGKPLAWRRIYCILCNNQ